MQSLKEAQQRATTSNLKFLRRYWKTTWVLLYCETSFRLPLVQAGLSINKYSYAAFIRPAEGFSMANAVVSYAYDTDRVLSLNAWTILPKGKTTTCGKSEVVDSIDRSYGSISSSLRNRSFGAVGDVFAYESAVENNGFFTMHRWDFQMNDPARDAGRWHAPGICVDIFSSSAEGCLAFGFFHESKIWILIDFDFQVLADVLSGFFVEILPAFAGWGDG